MSEASEPGRRKKKRRRAEGTPKKAGEPPAPVPAVSHLRVPRWVRLAVTVGLLAGAVAMPQLELPGVDSSAFISLQHLGVFSLGIMPWLSAIALVELAAAVVPRWRPLRHGGPEGRARLGRAVVVVAVALCLFQGFGIVRLIQEVAALNAPRLGAVSAPMVMLSLTAGAAFLGLMAQLAGRYGLASGFAVMAVGQPLFAVARSKVAGVLTGELSVRGAVVAAAGVAVVAAATVLLLRPPGAAPAGAAGVSGYRTSPGPRQAPPVAIPSLASGVWPILGAVTVLSLPETLAQLGVPGASHLVSLLHVDAFFRGAALVLIAGAAVFYTWLYHLPSRVAGVLARGYAHADGSEGRDAPSAAALEAEVRGEVRGAAIRSALFLMGIFAIGQATSGAAYSLADVAVATALFLDIVAELRARRALPDLVPVWPEHRSYALAAARAALSGAGIPFHARGENVHRLLQFSGPYAPIDLMVPRADAARAAEILGAVLRFRQEDEPFGKPSAAGPRRPWTRAEASALAFGASLVAVTVLLPGSFATPAPRARGPARPQEALQLLEVDDEPDPLGTLTEPPPPGIRIEPESTPAGVGRTLLRHYARVEPLEGEALENARIRLLAWATPVLAQQDHRTLAGPVVEYEPENDRVTQVGWRTWVVKGAPIADGSDVVGAVPREDRGDRTRLETWSVLVELGPAAAERFRAFTASHVKRRLAIVVDGVVESAPVIVNEIPGGKVSITMGSGGSPDQQRAMAGKLAEALMGAPIRSIPPGLLGR